MSEPISLKTPSRIIVEYDNEELRLELANITHFENVIFYADREQMQRLAEAGVLFNYERT